MAITQVGSILRFEKGTANSGSQSIDVPVGTDFVAIGITGHEATAGLIHSGLYTFPKGGVATPMGAFAADTNSAAAYAGLCFLAGPDVGSAKNFTYDFAGTGTLDVECLISATFWQGVNQLDPVRDGKGLNAAASTVTTSILNSRLGDLVLAYAGFYAGAGEGSITTWTNLTELAELTKYTGLFADGAWATGSPAFPQAIGVAAAVNFDDGGIVGIALRSQADPAVVAKLPSLASKRDLHTRRSWR